MKWVSARKCRNKAVKFMKTQRGVRIAGGFGMAKNGRAAVFMVPLDGAGGRELLWVQRTA
jgi:hypothetical protein